MQDPTQPMDVPTLGMEWKQTLELGYALQKESTVKTTTLNEENKDDRKAVCFNCGQTPKQIWQCSQCRIATYCQKECQIQHWKKKKHKHGCASMQRIQVDGRNTMTLASEEHKTQARNELFGRIRFYACPWSVHKMQQLGKGFLFIQSELTLAQMSLTVPQDTQGRMIEGRGVLLHYLTLGEYDSEVCREDFELTEVRTTLQQAVAACEEQTQLVLLMRFRCGHVAVGVTPLVPDINICRALAAQYYADSDPPALQLHIDDDE